MNLCVENVSSTARVSDGVGLEGTLLLRNRLERGRINGEVFERHLSDAGSDYAGRRSRILRLVLAVKLLKTPQKSRLDFSSVFFRGFVRFSRSFACVMTTWLRGKGIKSAGQIMLVSYTPLALQKFCRAAASHAAALATQHNHAQNSAGISADRLIHASQTPAARHRLGSSSPLERHATRHRR